MFSHLDSEEELSGGFTDVLTFTVSFWTIFKLKGEHEMSEWVKVC